MLPSFAMLGSTVGQYADPEARAAYVRDWHKRHREQRKEHQRKWDEANPESVRAKVREYKTRNPEKHRAHEAVRRALKSGRLVRGPCEHEGADCRGQVEAHHDDYEQRLDVRWLCKAHHTAEHYPTEGESHGHTGSDYDTIERAGSSSHACAANHS